MTDETNDYVNSYELQEEARRIEDIRKREQNGLFFEPRLEIKDIYDPRNSMNLSLDDLG